MLPRPREVGRLTGASGPARALSETVVPTGAQRSFAGARDKSGSIQNLDADGVARAIGANEACVLDGFGFAFDGDGGEGLIGRVVWQAREAYAEAVLFELYVLLGGVEARGFNFSH